MKIFLKVLKKIVTGSLKGLGLIQKFIILSLIYFLLIGPFKIITSLFRINLLERKPEPYSYWQDKGKVELSLESCRRLS